MKGRNKMKKLIFTLIICIGLITIGCENSLNSRENFNTNTSSEINDRLLGIMFILFITGLSFIVLSGGN